MKQKFRTHEQAAALLNHLPWSTTFNCWISDWGLIDESNMDMYAEPEFSRGERPRAWDPPQPDLTAIAILWLSQQPHRKNVNRSCSSYTWKHIAERKMAHYISNGALLHACDLMGLRGTRIGLDPNALLPIGVPRRRRFK